MAAGVSGTVLTEPVRIDALSSDGSGVGRLSDGRVVFVPRSAPGDLVDVKLVRAKKRWARAEVVRVIEEGPGRREPPCRHFASCGGCALQHMNYVTQLQWKSRIVGDALRRLGGFDLDDPVVHPSPDELRYRTRLRFTAVADGRGAVGGFRHRRDAGRIVDVDVCLLGRSELDALWSAVRGVLVPDALAPVGSKHRITVRTGDGGPAVLLESAGTSLPVARLREALGPEVALGRVRDGQVSRLDDRGGEPERAPAPGGEGEPRGPGAAFSQVNPAVAERIGQAVTRAVLEGDDGVSSGEASQLRVVDAYAGTAVHGRRLAEAGATVVAIESNADAVRHASEGAPAGLTVEHGLVEDRLLWALPADVVIVNPPRAGISDTVADVLVDRRPPRVVYASCDPATLARDLERLSRVYEICGVEGYDMFPQTPHVEVLVTLRSTSVS